MNQRKPTKHQWYSLGLTALLCMAFMVLATGTAFARYRTEREAQVSFAVRESEQITIGTMRTVSQEEAEATGMEAGTQVFEPVETLVWETVNDRAQLKMTVANGTSETEYSLRPQKIRVRLIGTLGLWTGMETVKLYLQIPSAQDPETIEMIQAAVNPIGEGTALYHTHGPGWTYSFLNADGEELTWTLPGSEFSHVDLIISMDGAAPQEDASLQPQVFAEVVTG